MLLERQWLVGLEECVQLALGGFGQVFLVTQQRESATDGRATVIAIQAVHRFPRSMAALAKMTTGGGLVNDVHLSLDGVADAFWWALIYPRLRPVAGYVRV